MFAQGRLLPGEILSLPGQFQANPVTPGRSALIQRRQTALCCELIVRKLRYLLGKRLELLLSSANWQELRRNGEPFADQRTEPESARQS